MKVAKRSSIVVALFAIAIVSIMISTLVAPGFREMKETSTTSSQNVFEERKRTISLLSYRTYAADLRKISNNTYYALCSTKGDIYYLKLIFEIKPPLKSSDELVLNISSNVGIISVTLYSSKPIMDIRTKEYYAQNWYNIQIANYMNRTASTPIEAPPIKSSNFTIYVKRDSIETYDVLSGERLKLYPNVNKTLEIYGNEYVKAFKVGLEELLTLYGEHYTVFLTLPLAQKPSPIADRLLVEISYPKNWIYDNKTIPWIIVSVKEA